MRLLTPSSNGCTEFTAISPLAQNLMIERKLLNSTFFLINEGLGPNIQYPNFYNCHMRDGHSNCQALRINGTCFHDFYRTIGNKEAVIKLSQEHFLCLCQHRGSRQKCLSLIFFQEEFDHIFSQLLPEGLASNQPAYDS